jgi:hypothetical protein
MKLLNLFEAEERRWPKASGRENPPTKEMIEWLNKFTRKIILGYVPYDHKNYWIDEKDGRLCAYQTTNISFKKVTDQVLPSFKIKEAGWVGFDNTCDFTDFSWLPEKLNTLVFLNSNVKSLKGIHKSVKEVKELCIGKNVKNGLLDVARIQTLGKVINKITAAEDRPLFNAINLLQKCKKQNLDVLDIQDSFIDAGLEKFL